MLPEDCAKWLASKGKINRAGDLLAEDPADYTALRQVQCYRLFRAQGFPDIIDAILPSVDERSVRVAGRLKRLPSIVRKIGRSESGQLARIADVLGLRIICTSFADANELVRELESLDNCVNSTNYCESPRSTGYRCWHLILRQEYIWPGTETSATFDIEIQIRTYWQHLWAQESESFGEQVKEGSGPEDVRRYLLELSDRIAVEEQARPDAEQTEFSASGADQNAIVVKRILGGAERPRIEQFHQDYSSATRQLLRWEEDIAAGQSETLFLIGVGDVRGLGVTHSVFLGAQEIPLPDWTKEIEKPSAAT